MTPTLTPDLAQAEQPMQQPQGQDPTPSDPNRGTPEQNAEVVQLTEDEKKKLLELRRDYKLSWAPNRRARVKQVLRAFEVLKGNPYVAFDSDGFQWYDPIGQAIQGGSNADDEELYRFNNNIYQMLCLSFMAALSAGIPKVRYQPEDADDEMDLATARRASTMMAIVERKNNVSSLQKQELLHLWTGGCYFSYSRYVIDADRAGVTQQPVIQPVDTQVSPDRFLCPNCGDVTPADEIGPWTQPMCPNCRYQFGEEDFHPSESLPIPQEVGTQEVPNGMVMINIFGLMNVDAAPYATDLYETPILDLEVETDIAAIRGNYPAAWTKLSESVGVAGTPEGDSDRVARIQQTSSAAMRSGYLANRLITYSRCWIQPWAFNHIDDQETAEGLKKKFPTGCKLVSVGDTEFLEATPSKLTENWTWCGTVRGMGIYPFAVGDAALDVQDRINDTANIIHEHMDRTASPTILIDDDIVDSEALAGKSMPPGRMTPVKRRNQQMNKPLSDIMFQPQFHVDSKIYDYGENLIQLAQLVSGVLPQIFGGSDPNVKTASGQQQMLNTALGRLNLFWDQIREEHARRAENCVKSFAKNMGDKVRFVERSEDNGFENEYVMLSEMQGSFEAYPESDQGFPSTYAEIRDRLMQMMADVNNPFVQAFMGDPDNIKVVARYLAPPDIKVPNDDARTKYKRIIGELAKSEPFEVMPEEAAAFGMQVMAPTFLPQTDAGLMLPDPDFDAPHYDMIVELCIKWGMSNWKMRETNPAGYENVRAYLRLAAQKQQEAAVRQAVTAAQVATQNGPPGAPSAAPPGGAPQPAGA